MAAGFLPQEFIRAKRDGGALSGGDIRRFVQGITDKSVSEGQVSAFAMAVFFRGLAREETVALTLAMRDSGTVLAWPELDRPVTDKHSTGGVGDNVSLMLAPIVAACGAAVPMISGRGLGHTGGTLDKMDSIPGYATQPDEATFRRVTKDVGCAIIGQTGDLAPADKRFYAIRDVTGTVESIPLITASILSKKLAAGLQSLVLDVKSGNGAFMPTHDESRALAQNLVAVANGAGLPTTALLTGMSEPLASAAGNAVEVMNAVEFLTGARRDGRLEEVTLALAAEMLVSAGLHPDVTGARVAGLAALQSGRAAEVFALMVHALGGPADFVEKPATYLRAAPIIRDVPAPADGFVAGWQAREVGVTVLDLGGGRRRAEDAIDHSVGFDRIMPVGTPVSKGDPVARVHAASVEAAQAAARALLAALTIAEEPVNPPSAVIERIAG
ncbi:MAG: thymidine phosphorylase [Rhizobiaceae bacterium]|nr:thymidine phosphorylase [Rhizobiaceae bacterium]